MAKHVYQCPNCGRRWLSRDPTGDKLIQQQCIKCGNWVKSGTQVEYEKNKKYEKIGVLVTLILVLFVIVLCWGFSMLLSF